MAVFFEDDSDREIVPTETSDHSPMSFIASSVEPGILRRMLIRSLPVPKNIGGTIDPIAQSIHDHRINTTLTTVANWLLVYASAIQEFDPILPGFLMSLSEEVRDQVQWSADSYKLLIKVANGQEATP